MFSKQLNKKCPVVRITGHSFRIKGEIIKN